MRQRRRLIYEIHRNFFSIVWTFSIGMMYEQLIKIYCLFASEKPILPLSILDRSLQW